MIKLRLLPVLLLFAISGLSGCHQTYQSERITDDSCPFRGVPANVHRAYLAQVTWSKTDKNGTNITTTHTCRLPVLYGVDIQKAPLGVTHSAFTMNDSGQITGADGQVDEKVAEIITSLADLAKSLPTGATHGETSQKFMPDLDNMMGDGADKLGYPIGIHFTELH